MRILFITSFFMLIIFSFLSCSNANNNKNSDEKKDNDLNQEKYDMIVFSGDNENIYESLADLIPSDEARKLYVIATDSFQSGKLDEGVQIMRDALKIAPENKVILKDIGIMFDQWGKTDSAKYYLGKCLLVDSTYSSALSAYGLMLYYQDSCELAIQCFDNALQYSSDPSNYYIYYYNKAITYEYSKMADSACKYFKLLDESCPEKWRNEINKKMRVLGCK